MMLAELSALLASVSEGSGPTDYREAILQQNVLGKATDSTRKESLRRLRELYALDESVHIFGLMRKLHGLNSQSLATLAVQVAWAHDPLFRATTPPVLDAAEGGRVETISLAEALDDAFPNQYSEQSRDQTARHAASSWTQSGHLAGRAQKVRRRLQPSVVSVVMALFLGQISGFHGATVFANPWCRLLDLTPDQALARAREAHRAGLLNLRAVGEVVDLSFPLLTAFLPDPS